MRYLLLLCSHFFVASTLLPIEASAIECPAVVRIAYHDGEVAPFFLGNGRSVIPKDPGLAIAWNNNALHQSGCHPEMRLIRLPARRLDHDIFAGSLDIALGLAPSAERLKYVQFPLRDGRPDNRYAIGIARFFLYTPKPAAIRWSEKKTLPLGTVVGVVMGQLPERMAMDRGWTIDTTHDMESNLHKLSLGRVNVVLAPETAVAAWLKTNGNSIQKLEPPVETLEFYAPVSQAFLRRYPEFVQRYWRNICQQSRAYFTQLPECPR